MAKYRTVSMSFWTDGKVVDDFSPEDKYFYLYLFTNPHTNLCGCYEISIRQMSYETGLNSDSIEKLLHRFCKTHNVIRYSKETKEILLINWCKYNWTESEKFRKPLLKEISEVKEKTFREYLDAKSKGKDVGYGIDTYCIDTSDGIDTTVTVTDIYTSINSTEDNNISITSTEEENSSTKSKKNVYTEDFETFWEAYPRKEGKGYAFDCFKKAIKGNDVDVEVMVEAINRYKQTAQWQENNGKYIPQPSTWLNQKRWEDSPQAKSNKSNSGGDDKWERAAQTVRERSGLL